MASDFDDATVTSNCCECGTAIKERYGRLKMDNAIICDNCGASLKVDLAPIEELLKLVPDALAAQRDLFGKTSH